MGRVRIGRGNNGRDGTEGAIYRNAVGCYLHGSLLPKNPVLADWLIARALERRHGPVDLQPLPDHDRARRPRLGGRTGRADPLTARLPIRRPQPCSRGLLVMLRPARP